MSWIGTNDLTSAHFDIRGIGAVAPDARPPVSPNEILPRGSLMIETRFLAECGAAQEVLRYDRVKDWHRRLVVTLQPEGGLVVASSQGHAHAEARLNFPPPPRDSRIRITYSWDGPARRGRISAEILELGRYYVADMRDPLPMPVLDAKVIIQNRRATRIGPENRFVAISDEIEPVGLSVGIAAGTPVETPNGPVAVERLRLGDMVVTAENGYQPLRWISRRKVPALGSFRPVRLRAPFFGLGQDVLVAPDHRIRMGGAEAEYMLGEDEVLIEAAHLVNGTAAKRDKRERLVTYYHLLLDAHDCLLHDSLWAESLFVGAFALSPDLVRASTLAEMPVSAIPFHRTFARPRLSDFEARSLAAALRA